MNESLGPTCRSLFNLCGSQGLSSGWPAWGQVSLPTVISLFSDTLHMLQTPKPPIPKACDAVAGQPRFPLAGVPFSAFPIFLPLCHLMLGGSLFCSCGNFNPCKETQWPGSFNSRMMQKQLSAALEPVLRPALSSAPNACSAF